MSVYNSTDPVEDESHQMISSYFLGPKAENFEFLKKLVNEILEAQRDQRLDYFPRDGKFITENVQLSTAYRNSVRRITNATRKAAFLLGRHSVPFWSPRYQGHMCCDVSMPAVLGYFMAMIYNPNNVTFEVSPLTTIAEMETGDDLCHLFGYNTDIENTEKPLAWGHIVCGGTVANMESMWVARNLKFYPLSILSAMKNNGPLAFAIPDFKIETCKDGEKDFAKLTTWELLNLKPKTILDIPERLYRQYNMSPGFLDSVMKEYGIQSKGKSLLEQDYGLIDLSYFVCNTKHYSWPKSGALLGLGSMQVQGIQPDHGARIDINDLRDKLNEAVEKKIPVCAVVAMMGTTEEGAVDPLSDILDMKEEFEKEKGLSFMIHADAAWGGYFATMLPGKSFRDLRRATGFVPDASLRVETQKHLYRLKDTDSITVDPHKAAYVPYPAGALCYRDGRMRFQVTWTSPYIGRGETKDTSIGIYGIEGSKPGAAAMATWFSNRCIGLDYNGYGKLLGQVSFTCSRLAAHWAAMSTEKDDFHIRPTNELPSELAGAPDDVVEAERRRIRENILDKTNEEIVAEDEGIEDYEKKNLTLLRAIGSDLNVNTFGVNFRLKDGTLNTETEEANYLSVRVIRRLSVDSPEDDPTKIPFFLTQTTFKIEDYGECAQHLKKRLGLYQDQVGLTLMRNVVMSPWPTDGNFIAKLIPEFTRVLNEEIKVSQARNDASPSQHSFLLQGTDKAYIILFPKFHMEKDRHQLIIEVTLPPEAMKTYLDKKKQDKSARFVLTTTEDINVATLVQSIPVTIKGTIKKVGRKPGGSTKDEEDIATNVGITTKKVLKAKSLRARYSDPVYPAVFPFYIYGTSKSTNIDHILVRSPNIQLSADDVTLDPPISDVELEKGAILTIEIPERMMQPFQSTEGSLGDTLGPGSNFFFQPGKQHKVKVFQDPKAPDEPGPGLVALGRSLGEGTLTLGEGVHADSYLINKDPHEIVEGDEFFRKWKAAFDSIGRELESWWS